MKKRFIIFFIVFIIIGYIIINLLYLNRYPQTVGGDLPWYSGPAYMFVKEGNFRLPQIPVEFFGDNFLLVGRIYLFIQVFFIKLFSFSLWAIRIPSFITGLVCLLLVFVLTKRLYTLRIAITSTCFLGASSFFIVHSHLSRPEMLGLLLLLLMISLFIKLIDSKKLYLGFFTGLCSTLGVSIHHSTTFFLFTLLVLIFIFRKNFNRRILISIMGGVIVGLILWFALHFPLKDFLKQYSTFSEIYGSTKFVRRNIYNAVISELGRYYVFFWTGRGHKNMFLLFIFLVSIFTQLFRKRAESWIIFAPIFTFFLFNTFFGTTTVTHHIHLIFPFLIVLTAVSINDMFLSHNLLVKNLGRIMFISTCLFFFLENILILYLYRNSNFNNFAKKLQEHIPKNVTILGPENYWSAFRDEKYYGNETLPYLSLPETHPLKKKLGNNFGEFITRNKIMYIISDENVPINDFFKPNCELVGKIADPVYGGPSPIGFQKDKKYHLIFIYRVKGK